LKVKEYFIFIPWVFNGILKDLMINFPIIQTVLHKYSETHNLRISIFLSLVMEPSGLKTSLRVEKVGIALKFFIIT